MDLIFSENNSAVTEGVRVSVRSAYIKEESSPDNDQYVFAYHVTITNESRDIVQLVSRKWFITDGLGRKRMVSGEGVIGKKPILNPGEEHEYVSGCSFNTPMGEMQGYYVMVRLSDNEEFRVSIPSFTMVLPYILN